MKSRVILLIVLFALVVLANACTNEKSDNTINTQAVNEIAEENQMPEFTTASNTLVEVTCPNVKFLEGETEKLVYYQVNHLAPGSTEFGTSLKCDGNYLTLNTARLIVEKGTIQVVKAKLKSSYKQCEFGVTETQNPDKLVKCTSTIAKA